MLISKKKNPLESIYLLIKGLQDPLREKQYRLDQPTFRDTYSHQSYEKTAKTAGYAAAGHYPDRE